MEKEIKYNNPIPVAVAIVPVVKDKVYNIKGMELHLKLENVLYVRRNIEPKKGMLAIPGGFVNEGERLETGGKRELKEEVGLLIEEDDFKLFRSEITPNNRNLIFGITPKRTEEVIKELNENLKNNNAMKEETQEFVIGNLNIKDAAFPLHQKAIEKYLDMQNGLVVENAKIYYDNSEFTNNILPELIKLMKNDGYLSNGYELKSEKKIKFKR